MVHQLRLAEPLGILASAADLSVSRPPGSCLTGSVVAARLARALEHTEATVRAVYYTSLFRFIGCSATGPEAGQLALGDDQGFSLAFLLCDWTDLNALEVALEESVARDAPERAREAAFDTSLSMSDAFPDVVAAHCAQSATFARRLPLPDGVEQSMPYFYARWDGAIGVHSGDDIPIVVRLVSVAHVAEIYRRVRGVDAAREEVAERAGKHLDPNLCSALLTHWDDLFADVQDTAANDLYLSEEPGDPVQVSAAYCKQLAEIGADLTDQKFASSAGHSRRVAALAGQAGQFAGLNSEHAETLRHAALLHDLGKCCLSNGILEKGAKRTRTEQLEYQSYSFQTHQLLASGAPFDSFGSLSSSADERFDGSGFHRAVPVKGLSENILAAANLYDEIASRPGTSADAARATAMDALSDAASAGKIAPLAVTAVLKAAGATTTMVTGAMPYGLTPRQTSVLLRLVRGETTSELAQALNISEKTADHHVQSIYDKTGARGRVAVALFAIEHGLAAL